MAKKDKNADLRDEIRQEILAEMEGPQPSVKVEKQSNGTFRGSVVGSDGKECHVTYGANKEIVKTRTMAMMGSRGVS